MGLLERIRMIGQPYVDPGGVPLSVPGRAHVNGFLQLEELNQQLVGRQGLEIFDRMFRTDGDISQVVHLVANPIISGTWEVEPAGGAHADQDAQDDAEFIRWALFENMQPNLRGHLTELLPVLFRAGFAPFEKVWAVEEYQGQNVTTIRGLQLRLPRTIYRWKQDQFGGLEAIEQYLPVPSAQVIAGPNVVLPGDPVLSGSTQDDDVDLADPTITTDTRSPSYRQTVWLPMSNLIYYRIGAEGDNWEGVSLLRPAYKHWLFKDAIERMDALAQEREALGIPCCYPPLGATPEQMDAMEAILANIRSNSQGYVLMPGPKATGGGQSGGQNFGQGWLLEWLTTGQHGTGRDPGPSLQYHTDKIAAAFLAEFVRQGRSLTGGTRGVAQFEPDPFLVSVESFAGLIEDIVNSQIVAPLIAYNRPKAKTLPRVKMSLVDSTTLTELADFLLKLIQVGALIPDQQLEDFVRARADLPPSSADAVKERGDLDDSLRREIIMGKNGNSAEAPTGTNGPAGSSTGGNAPGSKPADNQAKAPGSAAPTSAHDALTRRAIKGGKSLSQVPADEPPYLPGTERLRWRPQATYEMSVDLDGIEDHFDSAPERMTNHCDLSMCMLARSMAENHPERPAEAPDLEARVNHILDDAYGFGQQTVSQEIERHMQGDGYALSAARVRALPTERAHHATTQMIDHMHHAIAHSHMQGDGVARKQAAAEKAGRAALKAAARTHAVAAFNLGRDVRLLDAAETSGMEWGVRYTAILDKNTCPTCRAADDGVIRALDDPVRLANQPPNPECDSTMSLQGNQCRCFEIPEPMPKEH